MGTQGARGGLLCKGEEEESHLQLRVQRAETPRGRRVCTPSILLPGEIHMFSLTKSVVHTRRTRLPLHFRLGVGETVKGTEVILVLCDSDPSGTDRHSRTGRYESVQQMVGVGST